MTGLALQAALLAPVLVSGQDPDSRVKAAFFRTVADHFEVPPQEVAIVGDWDLAPDEVPVVFFLSKQAGVSPDALIGHRRQGRSWMEVCSRFGLGVGAFHLTFPPGTSLGFLARAYEEFNRYPVRDWAQINLVDEEIVGLVNLRVLSEGMGVSLPRVLRAREEAGSFLAAFSSLRGR